MTIPETIAPSPLPPARRFVAYTLPLGFEPARAFIPTRDRPAIRRVAERSNIVHCSELDRRGHFAAMEQPK
jgi:hypothetical protein